MNHSLEEQIKCVAREIALRKNVYPKWVTAGKMKNEEATRQLDVMESVLLTLKALDEHGGLKQIYHKLQCEKRYKERMETDKEFRQGRLQYFKNYYQQNKEKIKMRNIYKDLKTKVEHDSVYIG